MERSIEIFLSDDHQRIDRLYEEFLSAKSGAQEDCVGRFRKYSDALLRHIRVEEELVFPNLVPFPSERASREVDTLLEEHKTIVALLREVEEKLRMGIDTAKQERKLFEELHEHNAREEMWVYPPLDRLLDDEQKQSIFIEPGPH